MTGAAGVPDGDCVFCSARARSDAESLILTRGPACFVLLNLYPYNNGHLMVAPNRHIGSLADASQPELAELMTLTRRAEIALTEAYRPDGMNMGLNLGRSAGAGVPGHLHMHVVPRWNGDTNFMTVVASTRVVPETPSQTLQRLTPMFARLAADAG